MEKEADSHTIREVRYDATGDFEVYRKHVARTMEKPYPDNSGFYGMGCLREMGLRRSKHVGDWRTHSTFKNKEEEFRQPLKGLDTVLEKGLTIRSSGGIRKPGSAVGETESEFDEPQKGRATIRQNISIIRSFGESLSLPKEVAERRNFEQELSERNQPTSQPMWPIKFAYKLFRIYDCPYPAYNQKAGTRPKLAPNGTPDAGPPPVLLPGSPTAEMRSRRGSVPTGRVEDIGGGIAPFETFQSADAKKGGGMQKGGGGRGGGGLPPIHQGGGGGDRRGPEESVSGHGVPEGGLPSIKKGAKPGGGRQVSTALALKVEVIKGDELPRMDTVAVNTSAQGCDPFVVLRFNGKEVCRTKIIEGSYSPEWNETFVIPINRISHNEPLILQVWDEDDERGELIGQDTVNFASLQLRTRSERWYTITAEGNKAKLAVSEKLDSTHAGRVLLGLTIGFAHEFVEEMEKSLPEVTEGDSDTQKAAKWGGERAEDEERDSKLGRRDNNNQAVRALFATRLEILLRGVNVTSRPDLWKALDLLLTAQRRQMDGRLFEARQYIEESLFYANQKFEVVFSDKEDRMLAAKVAMACTCLIHETDRAKASKLCLDYLEKLVESPELQRSLDEEIRPSDPDHKELRSTVPTECACPRNFPGSQGIRHRELEDIRSTLQAAEEELDIRPRPPSLRESGRDGTSFPGPDGRPVDSTLELVSCVTPLCLEGHFSAVNALAMSRDWLFTASNDQTIRVWDMTTYALVAILDLHHRGAIRGLAVGGGHYGLHLYSCSIDHTVKSFDISDEAMLSGRTIRCVHTCKHHKGPVQCIATHFWEPPDTSDERPKGWRLYSAGDDRTLLIYECMFMGVPGTEPGKPDPLAVLKGHRSAITCIAVGRRIVFSGSLDSTVRSWSIDTYQAMHTIDLKGNLANSIVCVAGRLYAGTSDRAVLALDMATLKVQARLEGHTAYVSSVVGSQSRLSAPMRHLAQVNNPYFEDPNFPGRPISVQLQPKGHDAKRFTAVTIGVLKARELESRDSRPGVQGTSDPYVRVTVGGPCRSSGVDVHIDEKVVRTRVIKESLRPRWNEVYTFMVPELYDIRPPSGSSILYTPVEFMVFDWNSTGDDELGHWKGTLGDLLPEPPRRKVKRGTAARKEEQDKTVVDGDDSGLWLFLRPDATVLGLDMEPYVGMQVGMSEAGQMWLRHKKLDDDSAGRPGIITELSKDKDAAKVLWEATKGKEKEGEVYPDGWESKFAFAVGRGGQYYLCVWDDDPQAHGQLMVSVSTSTVCVGEDLPLEPHRHYLVSGSDDETCRVWDLHSHSCVGVLEGQHSNKISALAFTDSNRLVSASQDTTVKVW